MRPDWQSEIVIISVSLMYNKNQRIMQPLSPDLQKYFKSKNLANFERKLQELAENTE